MDDEDLKELFGSNEILDIALSYSRISDYDRNGPKALNTRTEVSGEGVKIGSITDDWLFDKPTFEEKYFIYEGEKPTATLGKVVDIILKNYNETPSKEVILEIIENNNFWGRSKPETLLGYFDIPEFWEYLEAQYKSRIKNLVTTSELDLGKDLASILETHSFSKHIFTINDNIERINQYKFEYFYNNIKLRGIIDIVVIDHTNRTVQLIDLKTGQDNAENFMGSFIKYRYYFQALIYQNSFDIICKNLNLVDYKLLPFQFLYIGRKQKMPLVYTVTDKWFKGAQHGFKTSGGYYYRGLDVLLEEIKWHWDNKVFEMTKDIFINNGRIYLDDQFINVE